ncbi:MAG: cysteine hydrolase family protein [Lachnotalea sp.]
MRKEVVTMKFGLVMVDIQNDYFKGGKYELVNPEQASMQAKKVLTFFREQNWSIFHVRHISVNPGATFFLPDSVGAEFIKDCCPFDGEEIIIKHKPDSFLHTNLKEKLEEKRIDTLVVCGMMTHMCIDTTVRAVAHYGFAVDLIEDACATRDLVWGGMTILAEQVQNAYMAALADNFAKIYQTDVWIKEHE